LQILTREEELKMGVSRRGVSLGLLAVLAVSGCSRGNFGSDACVSDERTDIPANATYAIYLDASGNAIGNIGEELEGTENNRMCPTPEPDGPGGCTKAGYCLVNIGGQNYCIKCPS
jgi:hypothetical protein